MVEGATTTAFAGDGTVTGTAAVVVMDDGAVDPVGVAVVVIVALFAVVLGRGFFGLGWAVIGEATEVVLSTSTKGLETGRRIGAFFGLALKK